MELTYKGCIFRQSFYFSNNVMNINVNFLYYPRRINFIILVRKCLDTFRRKTLKKALLIQKNLLRNSLSTKKKLKRKHKRRKRSFQSKLNIPNVKELTDHNLIGTERPLLSTLQSRKSQKRY
jgi:hypothetical protein